MEEARVFLENVLPVRERGGTMICGSVEEFGEAQTGSKLGKIVIGVRSIQVARARITLIA